MNLAGKDQRIKYEIKGGGDTPWSFYPGRAIGIFRVDGKTSLRGLEDCIRKVLCVDMSSGFIYGELRRISQIAERINSKTSSLVSLSHCVRYEVWIKVAKTKEAWNFCFLAASPKYLFIGFFDYMAKRDEHGN